MSFSFGPRWPPLKPKHLVRKSNLNNFNIQIYGKIFWMKDMFVGWFCAALSWCFFLISCLTSLHSINVARALIALKVFLLLWDVEPGNFSWPVTPTAGRREWRSCRRIFGLHTVLDQGSLNCLLGGHQTMQTYGKFEGFPWISTEQCTVWVGNLVDETRCWRIRMDTQKISQSFLDWFNQGSQEFPTVFPSHPLTI